MALDRNFMKIMSPNVSMDMPSCGHPLEGITTKYIYVWQKNVNNQKEFCEIPRISKVG
jgi:hypothetical protein